MMAKLWSFPISPTTFELIQSNSFSPKIFLKEAVDSVCHDEQWWLARQQPSHDTFPTVSTGKLPATKKRFVAPFIPPFYVNSSRLDLGSYDDCVHLIAERYFSLKQAELYAIVPLIDDEINRRLQQIAPWDYAPLRYHLTGSIMGYMDKYTVLQSYANDERVETICEIGFNAGHSTLLMALNNPKAQFLAFDIFYHNYSALALSTLQEIYPNRDFLVIPGDSITSVPRFHRRFPHERCNLIFIDGGHDILTLRHDIEQMSMLANRSFHRLIVDDTPQGFELYHEYMAFTVMEVPEDKERNMYPDMDNNLKPRFLSLQTCAKQPVAYSQQGIEVSNDRNALRRQMTDEYGDRQVALRHIAQHNVHPVQSPCFSWVVMTYPETIFNYGALEEKACESDALNGQKSYDSISGMSIAEYLFE
jgi:hypothetical protein